MLPHRRDPYLWIHLAGLATVPLWLDGCLVGLAVGEPQVPPWLELIPLAAIGTGPLVWMQWQRPFYIFSVPGLALRPDKLSPERRRLLTIQRGWLSRSLVFLTAMGLLWVLYTLYQVAPLATDLPWLAGRSRLTGWFIAAIAYCGANLFALVPATVVPLFLTNPARLKTVPPIEASQILSKFTVIGLRLGKILPEPESAEMASPDELANPPASTPELNAEVDLESPPAESDDSVAAEHQPAVESQTIAATSEGSQTEQVPTQDVDATPENSVEESAETVAEVAIAEATDPAPSAIADDEMTADSPTVVEMNADGADTRTETPAATDAAAGENGTGSSNSPQPDEI